MRSTNQHDYNKDELADLQAASADKRCASLCCSSSKCVVNELRARVQSKTIFLRTNLVHVAQPIQYMYL